MLSVDLMDSQKVQGISTWSNAYAILWESPSAAFQGSAQNILIVGTNIWYPMILLNSLCAVQDLMEKKGTIYSNRPGDRRRAPLGPDTPLFGTRIPPGTSTQSPNSSISPSTPFDIFDGARRLLEARHGRPDASRVDPGTSSAFGEQ
ncbi:hypothetical protein POSPLADRAFT_1162526 [Postia placenta MAD-698-R-SB12]|uniref:Uncharacterized protein n=1 Tax=Postia placenta MAD-698-R-SB12 TaxID=670580 RepID=A0A1X6MHU2_9APHY|nr:hypothetical protein POSPLADRAFT_1162526 [Postia placenta MAD-698-R-SB12]OSX55889.1 hypothetical protein POSPLADRAFT_1162526 [Postia placenta MAD-698-R-SB12]